MKRIFILAAVVGFSAGFVFAEQKTLIDFSLLTPDITVGNSGQNKQTLMDFSTARIGASFTDEQRAVLRTSMAYEKWEVELASSSKTVTNLKNSVVRGAESKEYGNVMGVRVHFPVEPFNSWALIKPAFDIPAFNYDTPNDDGSVAAADPEAVNYNDPTRFENGYGVLKNVGTIKSIQVQVYGLNFPHSLSVVLENDKGEQKVMPMGALNFEGWAALTWDNPAYIQDVRARSIRMYPLYPANPGFIKFVGFIIQRDASNAGGDFVTYFKDVQVIYDKAEMETEGDIDNEKTWTIRKDREAEKTKFESERFGADQVLRFIEQEKQAPKTEVFTGGVANQQ